MKNVKIELTFEEVRTVYRALNMLKVCDEEQKQRDLLSEGTKKRIEREINMCGILIDIGGKVFSAW